MCKNEQKPEMESEPWKMRAPEPEAHSWKPKAPESVPSNKILHWANVCFSAHAIAQICEHTTSDAFREVKGLCNTYTNKSSTFSVGFRGISRLGSAFVFLRWFKLAHICIQVTSLNKWNKQGINHKFLIGNRFHVTLRA